MRKVKEIVWNLTGQKKKILLILVGIVVLLLFMTAFFFWKKGNAVETVYKETTVTKGNLTVGVTEEGSVLVGTVNQTFDIDMSAFEANSSDNNFTGNVNMGGAGGIFRSLQNSNSDSKDYTRALEVSEVFVTAGQKIEKGEALFSLAPESVESIETELVKDRDFAKLTLEKMENDQKTARLSAAQRKETSEAYGNLAENEYQVSLGELTTALEEKQEEIEEAVETVSENSVKIAEKKQQFEEALNSYEHAVYAVNTADKTLIYEYGRQEDARDTAKSTMDSLETEIETLEKENESLEEAYQTLLLELNDLQRDLETGEIEAKAACETRIATGKSATEAYAVDVGYLDADLKYAGEDYEQAEKKLQEFVSYTEDNTVRGEYEGVITEVNVEAGDSLSSAQTLITLNNQEDTTMTVTIDAKERNAISMDSQVNVTIDAYPNTAFTGEVEEIGDASTDSSTGAITYEVTVLIQKDVSGLLEGMTGKATFITKETREVLYVSNRAVIREGTRSYVKVKEEDGNIQKRKIQTGFSDGINVEIVEGLSEGATVLIESKVGDL